MFEIYVQLFNYRRNVSIFLLDQPTNLPCIQMVAVCMRNMAISISKVRFVCCATVGVQVHSNKWILA